jgi:hypothetical protein
MTDRIGSAQQPATTDSGNDKTEAVGEPLARTEPGFAADPQPQTAVGKSETGDPPFEPVDQTPAEVDAGLPAR